MPFPTAQDRDFADTNYKDLNRKICSIGIFKELTSVTKANLDLRILIIIGNFRIRFIKAQGLGCVHSLIA